MDPSRQTLNENALLALLNWELAAYEECEGCRFTAIRAADAGDAACNWSDAELRLAAPAGVYAQLIAQQVVAQTRRAYDLAR